MINIAFFNLIVLVDHKFKYIDPKYKTFEYIYV